MKFLVLMMSFWATNLAPIDLKTANLSPITKAISEGDATTLGAFFDETVDLTVLNKQDFLNKNRAVETVRQFFQNNKPKAFNAIHQSTSKGANSQYTLGDLTTATGSYRVYLYYRVSGDKVIIQEMRIEK